LIWRNQAKSSLSSQALDSSLFVGKSAHHHIVFNKRQAEMSQSRKRPFLASMIRNRELIINIPSASILVDNRERLRLEMTV
jgi:hypothetical protein